MLNTVMNIFGFQKKVVETKYYVVTAVSTPWSKSITVMDESTGYIYSQIAVNKSDDLNTVIGHVFNSFDYSDGYCEYFDADRKEAAQHNVDEIFTPQVRSILA